MWLDWLAPAATLLPLDTGDPVTISDTSNGAPWWVVIVAVVASVIGTMSATWATRRRDRSSNEQALIDQLQQEVRSLRTDLTAMQTEMRTLRVRDIAWITYTSDLTRVALEAGATPPQMPTELRVPPAAAPAAV